MANATSDQQLKHPTLPQFLQLQQPQQLLNTTIMWNWSAAPATGRLAPDEADDDITGATWPPLSYTCTFCRREFRSAQALGGHMNVHRRDRSRMRGHSAAQPKAPAPAAAEFAVLYPILNSNAVGAVFIPSGDVMLSSGMARAGHDKCHRANISGGAEEIDLELRLGWS